LRLGILGGAFNPPHIGHLVGAQEALVQLELDRVVFVPVGQAPHRELENDPGPETRLEMVELAIADDARFAASRIEIEREGPSYTVDTLRELRAAGPEDELFLVLGGDQAAALSEWHEPEEVLELAQVAVVERTNWSRNAIGIKVGRLKGAQRIRYLDMPIIQVSSTSVRRRIAAGQPIRYLVPDRVANQIGATGLYGAAGARSVAEASA
jgi:nicotinate-nucleotide adenylyltransferase